jgi:hypothetical protein
LKRLSTVALIAALSILALGKWAAAPALADDGTLCDQIGGVSGNAITASGSLNNIYQFDQTGSSFCRVLIHDTAYSVDASVIGVQALLDLQPTQAVDVFGMLENGISADTFLKPVRICLRGTGNVLYLQANDTTRTVQTLFGWEATPGYTCADVFNPGIVALAAGAPASASGSDTTGTSTGTTIDPLVPGDVNAVTPLTTCNLETTYGVYLRMGPSVTARIRYIFRGGVVLEATGKSGPWYLVTFNKKPGWISAAFVTPHGECG